MSSQPPAPERRAFAALRQPGFAAYFFATALAMMADNIEHVISYWVLYEKFRSPTLGGVAILTHWLPFLLLSVASGALADRYDNRRLIQVSMGMFMFVSLGWGLLFFTDSAEPWHAVVLLTIHGLAGVLWGPASQLLIHDIVGRGELQSAVRLNATSRQLGMLMGPAIGGGLMLLLGPPLGLLVNVLIYLPLVLLLWKAPYGRKSPAPQQGARGGGFTDTLALIRQIASQRVVMSMILLAAVSSFFVGNAFQAQMPEFAHDLGTDHAGHSYSILLSANAAGALAGGLILEARGLLPPHPMTAIVLTVLWSLSIAGFAITAHYPLAVALMFAAGFFNLAYNSMAQTLVQLHAPAHLRGRLIGLYNTANNGMRAFSGITVGFLGALVGIHWSLAGSALALLAVSLWLMAVAAGPRAR